MDNNILVKCDCECHNHNSQMMHCFPCCCGGMKSLNTIGLDSISICGLSITVDYEDGKSIVYEYDDDAQMTECFHNKINYSDSASWKGVYKGTVVELIKEYLDHPRSIVDAMKPLQLISNLNMEQNTRVQEYMSRPDLGGIRPDQLIDSLVMIKVKALVWNNPNDAELGGLIRQLINEKYDQ